MGLKIFYCFIMLAFLAAAGFVVTIFTVLMGGSSEITLIMAVLASCFLLFVFKVFDLYQYKKLKRGLFAFIGVFRLLA